MPSPLSQAFAMFCAVAVMSNGPGDPGGVVANGNGGDTVDSGNNGWIPLGSVRRQQQAGKT
ncbi:hypothetical protein GCM10023193_11870 [Planotetraspora kaengkrachanensis]|uniref:Uncharacterized protein n=1 Tax=Planotetraspora kaengkrachanensis TaxID=575193 RepID=A0A8J3PW62_9ACTN|nr:hypothetical protein Pka01_53310 [Planotetraspora kaengkrachanensis]